jgi:hypothetical protein
MSNDDGIAKFCRYHFVGAKAQADVHTTSRYPDPDWICAIGQTHKINVSVDRWL